jgi:hypothetical protein
MFFKVFNKIKSLITRNKKFRESVDSVDAAAKAYSELAVEYAQDTFRIRLDYSEKSIQDIEKMADKLCQEIHMASEESIRQMGNIFGSYVGEVFIKHNGGEWTYIAFPSGEIFPGIKDVGGGAFWPWIRVRERIIEGGENNIWDYYRWLKTNIRTDTEANLAAN